MKLRVDAKANIRNRFDIECRDIVTGEVQKFQAHNIVLDQMWSRLVNFQSFFEYIHFGTGDGSLSPTRTSLFSHLGTRAASDVSSLRELPTSYRQRSIVLNPEEYVDEEITEVGVAYGSGNTNLVTHAFLEDSEGNPISIVKTDTMVVTIYATIFFELGELESMYGGQWRWVMPLANNELLSYLMGATYPTQQFRVTAAPEFSDGTAPGSHGQSANILVANWIKDAVNKKVTTPVPATTTRLGVTDGNGEVRGFGLGSSDTSGTLRGQFPITGVFTSHAITGESLGAGDEVATGFNLDWNDPQSLVVYADEEAVDAGDYTTAPKIKGTDLFKLKSPQWLSGTLPGETLTNLTDGNTGTQVTITPQGQFGIDTGASVSVDKFRVRTGSINAYGGGYPMLLKGSNNADFSDATLIATLNMPSTTNYWGEVSFSPVSYRYYRIEKDLNGSVTVSDVELLTADDQITFHTPPALGTVITADYTVPYIPKDSNHVLDLQVAIQYGEGS